VNIVLMHKYNNNCLIDKTVLAQAVKERKPGQNIDVRLIKHSLIFENLLMMHRKGYFTHCSIFVLLRFIILINLHAIDQPNKKRVT